MNNQLQLPVNEVKVIDRTIDVYLYLCEDLNTAEVMLLSQKLIDLANRRATDVEMTFCNNRYPEEAYLSIEDVIQNTCA